MISDAEERMRWFQQQTNALRQQKELLRQHNELVEVLQLISQQLPGIGLMLNEILNEFRKHSPATSEAPKS
jgi:hypothetical protein